MKNIYFLLKVTIYFLSLVNVTNVWADKSSQNKFVHLIVVKEHQGPVIGPNHPDVQGSNNKSGFETGQVVKVNGVYHMFVNEMFGRHHLDMRIAHWSSTDAINWKRQSTIFNSIPGRSAFNPRSELWLTNVIFNEKENAWNIFYVAYRAGNEKTGEILGSDYYGRIWRAKSVKTGIEGINGPYADMGIVLQPDEDSQEWEGQQGPDSFNAYEVDGVWYAIYGGHFHTPRGPWPVGLAYSKALEGPWRRMPKTYNPIPIVKVFTENPVVSRLKDGRYLMVFDSLGDQEIGYSISEDGVNWPEETRLKVQTKNNKWAKDGDHSTRTPLCAIEEDDGTFTVIYTALMKKMVNFYSVGKCTLTWEK